MVWDILKPEGIQVPAILMSSHYMDECEALGSRIGILIDGETVATGTLSELYDKYCTSFFVEISFDAQADDDMSETAVLDAFENVSMNASIYESLPYHIKFQVPMVEGNGSKQDSELGQLATIFSLLESKKNELQYQILFCGKDESRTNLHQPLTKTI